MVCTGFGQALALMAAALDQGGGRSVAMEEYGLTHHLEILDHASFDTPLMGVDDAGARTSDLSDTDAAAVLLTPAHQFPIGVPLSAARRSAALEWARARRAVVIEDDYDGEFRYDARPVGALQSLAPELVAYVGTASKSLAPAVHLAWLAVPPGLLDAVVEAKRLADGFTGVLEQLTLDELIRSGAYDRHVRRSRMRYRRRRDRLVAELAVRSPQVSVTGIAAGLHAVVRLGAGLTASEEEAVCSRAARAGLGIQGLGRFRRRPDPGAAAALVVGYGTPPEHAFAGAVDALCDSLA
jgi:GntR family transcriptional regulator/MocR family aminotransferase